MVFAMVGGEDEVSRKLFNVGFRVQNDPMVTGDGGFEWPVIADGIAPIEGLGTILRSYDRAACCCGCASFLREMA